MLYITVVCTVKNSR